MKSLNLIIIICALVISSHCAFSQSYDNNWVFGDSIGLNFSTGEPVFFKTAINQTLEACATISNNDGDLLFYTNGQTVWDRTNSVMPNGDDLDIGSFTPGLGSSISQGVLIAPFPANDSLYYLIYLSRNDGWDAGIGLKYSTLNINLNGGLGDVVYKNVSLSEDTLTEKLQLVKHGNSRDWWLVALTKVQEEGEIAKFVKYIITPSGIEGPYYQNYGDVYHAADGPIQDVGYMKFSQQGDQLCIAKSDDVDVYDFNRCTGEFSNYFNIDRIIQEDDEINYVYGIAFSSDDKYFYVSTHNYAYSVSRPYLYQFCNFCAEPLEDTKTLIVAPDTGSFFLPMALAPDDKIYIGSYSIDSPNDSMLFVIKNPNASGVSCDFDTLIISAGGLTFPRFYGLPNMPNYNLGALVGSECDTLLPIQTEIPTAIIIYPNPSTGNIFISGSPLDLYTLTLYNLLGEKVFEQKNAPGNVQINLPVDNGIYEIVLRSADNIIRVEKLIIGK